MTSPLNRPFGIVVMGVSGCGKSTLASLIAAHYGLEFLEGDRFHSPANVAKMANAIPLTDDDRWPWLDDLGAALGKQAHSQPFGLTACSALKRVYRERLRESAGVPLRFLCLTGTREVLLARMAARKDHYMPVVLLDSQLATLELPHSDEEAVFLDLQQDPAALLQQALQAVGQ